MHLELPDISAELFSVDIQVKETEKGSRVHGASEVLNSTYQGEGELLRCSTCCSCVYWLQLCTKHRSIPSTLHGSVWVNVNQLVCFGVVIYCLLLFIVFLFSCQGSYWVNVGLWLHTVWLKKIWMQLLSGIKLWLGGGWGIKYLPGPYIFSRVHTLSRGLKKNYVRRIKW